MRDIKWFLIGVVLIMSCRTNHSASKEIGTKRIDSKSICYVSDSSTIKIVNQIILDFECWNKRYSEKVILDKNILQMNLDDYRRLLIAGSNSGFNISDSTYMLNQIRNELECVYNPKDIKALVVPNDTVINWIRDNNNHWDKFFVKYKSGIMVIDKPIINKSKDEALVSFSYSISGTEGTFELWIYRLVNMKWNKYKLISKAKS
jgi:hypothetical protein